MFNCLLLERQVITINELELYFNTRMAGKKMNQGEAGSKNMKRTIFSNNNPWCFITH